MTIADFIKGKSSKKIYFWYYLVVLSVFWVFFYFSLDAYPIPYRVRINQISHLGSPRLNPNGHHFFNIGMVFFGISVIPHLLFLYRKHERFMHITSTMALISAIAVCVGLVLLPLYPVDNWDPHEVLASIIFIGFMVVVVCYCYIWI